MKNTDMIVHCKDEGCLGNKTNLNGMLVIIGAWFHCPYCRGLDFTLKPSAQTMARYKAFCTKKKEDAQKRREAEKNTRNSV